MRPSRLVVLCTPYLKVVVVVVVAAAAAVVVVVVIVVWRLRIVTSFIELCSWFSWKHTSHNFSFVVADITQTPPNSSTTCLVMDRSHFESLLGPLSSLMEKVNHDRERVRKYKHMSNKLRRRVMKMERLVNAEVAAQVEVNRFGEEEEEETKKKNNKREEGELEAVF